MVNVDSALVGWSVNITRPNESLTGFKCPDIDIHQGSFSPLIGCMVRRGNRELDSAVVWACKYHMVDYLAVCTRAALLVYKKT